MKRAKHQEAFAEKLQRKAAPEARQLRKQAGDWLKQRRADAGLSQRDREREPGRACADDQHVRFGRDHGSSP